MTSFHFVSGSTAGIGRKPGNSPTFIPRPRPELFLTLKETRELKILRDYDVGRETPHVTATEKFDSRAAIQLFIGHAPVT